MSAEIVDELRDLWADASPTSLGIRALYEFDRLEAEVERLKSEKAWLSERLHDAVNTCYGGVTHEQIDACAFT